MDFALESAERGFPKSHSQLIHEANTVYLATHGSHVIPLGQGWLYGFFAHWDDELQTIWSHPLDTQWAKALNPTAMKHWLEVLVKEKIVDADVGLTGRPASNFTLRARISTAAKSQTGLKYASILT